MNIHYVAGLFDGEGWFHINKVMRRDCRRESFQVYACLSIRQRFVVDGLKKAFGGSVREAKARSPKHASSWRWTVVGAKAYQFAAQVRWLLLIKNQQAELAVKFQDFKSENKNQPNSPRRHSRLEAMYRKMRTLNKKGPK